MQLTPRVPRHAASRSCGRITSAPSVRQWEASVVTSAQIGRNDGRAASPIEWWGDGAVAKPPPTAGAYAPVQPPTKVARGRIPARFRRGKWPTLRAGHSAVFAEKMATPEREMGAGNDPSQAGEVSLEGQHRPMPPWRPESLRSGRPRVRWPVRLSPSTRERLPCPSLTPRDLRC